MKDINNGYKSLDQSTTTFDYPIRRSQLDAQVFLMPSSFAELDMSPITSSSTAYGVYGSVLYPSERTLMEDGDGALVPEGHAQISGWGYSLRALISQTVRYLGIKEDIIDNSDERRAINWYSKQFGRIYVDKNGPMDRRLSKRLGSGER